VETRAGLRLLFTCARCGLPFLASELLAHHDRRCGACDRGEPVPDLPSTAESVATEAEILAALSGRFRFVTAGALSGYVDRLARQIADRMGGDVPNCRVAFVDDDAVETLALPAGTLLVSRGVLGVAEDEAQLVFLLAHEVAHAASGDAAVLLGRMGFRATAKRGAREDGSGWIDAATDLILLGYGRKRERDADARAAETMETLGYDPASAIRLLAKIDSLVRAGDPSLAAYALAHPPANDRIRRLERALYGRTTAGAGKVNREVFRRLAGPAVWTRAAAPEVRRNPVHGAAPRVERVSGRRRRVLVAAIVTGAAILAAGALFALLR
jgi:predicted Zn-dependent protease